MPPTYSEDWRIPYMSPLCYSETLKIIVIRLRALFMQLNPKEYEMIPKLSIKQILRTTEKDIAIIWLKDLYVLLSTFIQRLMQLLIETKCNIPYH
jgi:hypothetical protein